ncbi:MAG: sodium:solute symporter family protein, partial [Phycisphaerae bacterium]|nr:sodium:solute symporter family protein [Phycisphaerae bacterium]
QKGPAFSGRIVKTMNEEKGHCLLQLTRKDDAGNWLDVEGKQVPAVLDKDQPFTGEAMMIDGREHRIATGRSIAIVYAKANAGQIIPTYITSAMPKWFGMVFLLTLLAAAMSTLSSQFHAVGTSIGRDVFEQVTGQHGKSIGITRIGIILGIVLAVLISAYARESTMIARATAIFFGLCASTFLPAFVGGLFFKRMTKAGAISSMVVGFSVTAFWLMFIKAQEAGAIGLVQKLTGGKTSLLADSLNWPVVDPLLIALPISILTAILVSIISKVPSEEHLEKCFSDDG